MGTLAQSIFSTFKVRVHREFYISRQQYKIVLFYYRQSPSFSPVNEQKLSGQEHFRKSKPNLETILLIFFFFF